ncbi:MAG TPA: hypothetical protein VFG68_23035 [Fimbriiglobus sp.]|nr:hypothetical protein [Fimbriiglobus sp.]
MYATLLTAVVLAQPPQPAAQPPGREPAARAASLDGNWTVLYCAKDGQAKADLKDKTVSIRNNVATFTGAGADMKPMRFELGPNNTIRVTETDATPGARPGAPGAPPPARPIPGSPAANQTKTGVFVHGGDFLSVALHDGRPAAPVRPAPPPGARPAPPPGTALGADRMADKADFVIVLKRAANGRTPGATPDRR